MIARTLPLIGLLVAAAAPTDRPVGERPAGGPKPAPAPDAAIAERVDDYLSRIEALGFSGAVLVAVGGEVVLEEGYGTADRETGRPVTAGTVFTVGSITKQFTAAAILALADRGALSVDDPIGRFFEGVPPDKAAITVHHLLTHTAGFPGAIGDDFEPIGRDAFVERALALELPRAAGERYEYSNVGYSLLGAIVEIASGRPYEAFLRETLFLPAGMEDTGYRLPGWGPGRVAVGYRGGERWGTVLERPWADDGPGWHLRANGGIHATVGDLWRWHLALAGDAILSGAAREAMFTPHVPEDAEGSSHYGYGWAIFTTARGTRLVAHDGGNGVFAADFRRYVDEDVVVVAASNVAEWSAIGVTPAIARIVFEGDVEIPPAVAPVDPDRLASYAGVYRTGGGGELEVAAVDGALRVAARGPAAFALLAPSPDPAADAERSERAREAMAAADRGDYAPLHDLFGGGIPLEEIAQQEEGLRRSLEERLGPRVETRVAGTGLVDGRPTTAVELVHERGSRWVVLRWAGDRVAGIGVREGPPGLVLHPESAESFFAFDLREGVVARARFELAENGRPTALVVEGVDARAERVEP